MAIDAAVIEQERVVVAAAPRQYELVKGLGLTSATMLVMGNMIGSGIFIVSADISRRVDSPALLIATWLITALLAIGGALAYGELAAMMPYAGGQYVYLRESLGPLCGFLYGWTMFLVIQTGTIAAVGVAAGKFLGVLFPSISSSNWLFHLVHVPPLEIGPMVLGNMDVGLNTQNLVSIVIVIVLTAVNVRGVKTGAAVQNAFTFVKIGMVLGLVAVALLLGRNAAALAANFGAGFWRNMGLDALHSVPGAGGSTVFVGTLTILAVAQVGSVFSSDAWNNVTFAGGEVRNPSRNLPLALVLGSGAVLLLYILVNIAYLNVLPLAGTAEGTTVLARGIQYASEDRVATAVIQQIFGPVGARIMAVAIVISCVGAVNGMILAGARVYYAMAKDGLFFRSAAQIDPIHRTPARALLMQCAWSCILCLSGSYGQLLDYVIFAVLTFFILTTAGVFVLRVKRPDAPRPYRAFGYPVLPAADIVLAIFVAYALLRYKPQYTWPGLVIVLLGIPVYFLTQQRRAGSAGR